MAEHTTHTYFSTPRKINTTMRHHHFQMMSLQRTARLQHVCCNTHSTVGEQHLLCLEVKQGQDPNLLLNLTCISTWHESTMLLTQTLPLSKHSNPRTNFRLGPNSIALPKIRHYVTNSQLEFHQGDRPGRPSIPLAL